MQDNNTDFDKAASDEAVRRGEIRSLRKRCEYLFVQRNGVAQVMPHFILQAAIPKKKPKTDGTPLSESPQPCLRAGVTASRKVGNAVLRNRAKRRMRALFRQMNATQICGQADYVMIARHSLVQADWPVLTADFTKATNRVNRQLSKVTEQGSCT